MILLSRWFPLLAVLLLSAAALAQQNPYPTGCYQFINHTEYCNTYADTCKGSLPFVIDAPNGWGQYDGELATLMCSNGCVPPGCTRCQNYPDFVVMINNTTCPATPPCSGNPTFTCCSGQSPICNQNGQWSCPGGGSGCPFSTTPQNCNAGQYPACQCNGSWQCVDLPGTPIVIDTDGTGFRLTSGANGVPFDLNGDGQKARISWTAAGSRNGWLALPAADGSITSGKQLFGNFTPQPESDHPNGFLALAVYDQLDHGGNGDGVIDWHDAVWPKLRIWIDSNHDGMAQPNELYMLPALGINSLGLEYTETPFVDPNGNRFRYKGKVNPEGQSKTDPVDRVMYDVFLVPYEPSSENWNGATGPALAPRPRINIDRLLVDRLK